MTIEERAKKEYPAVSPLDYPVTHDYNIAAKNGFIEGAKWMLEKATKWSENNTQNYYHGYSQADNCYFDDTEFLEDFKKAMEE